MTAAPDLAAWLREAVTERLELAREAAGKHDGTWSTGCECEGGCRGYPACEEVRGGGIHIYSEGGHDSFQAEHIAANDPQDTIARCVAELAILDLHVPLGEPGPPMCVICLEYVSCRTVRLLGSGYRHWDGYDASWAP